MGGGNNAGMRAAARPLLLPSQRRRVGRRRCGRTLARSRTRRRTRRSSGRACATSTGRCSGPRGASRRRGGSRPSTCSSAAWRRGRNLLNPLYLGGFDHAATRAVGLALRAPRCSSAARPRMPSASSTRRSSCSARRSTGCSASRARAGRRTSSPTPRSCTSAARRTAAGSTSRTCAATFASRRSTAGRARPSARGGCSSRSLRLRAAVFRGERGEAYRDGVRFLSSGRRRPPLNVPDVPAARRRDALVLLPGALVARALGQRSSPPSSRGRSRRLRRVGGRRSPSTAASGSPSPFSRSWPLRPRRSRGGGSRGDRPRTSRRRTSGAAAVARAAASCSGSCCGTSQASSAATGSSTWRASGSSSSSATSTSDGERVRRRRAPPGLRVPALARVPRARREAERARPGRRRQPRGVGAGGARVRVGVGGGRGGVPLARRRRVGAPRVRGAVLPRRGGRRLLGDDGAPGDRVAPAPRSGGGRALLHLRRGPATRRRRRARRGVRRARARAPDLRALPALPLAGYSLVRVWRSGGRRRVALVAAAAPTVAAFVWLRPIVETTRLVRTRRRPSARGRCATMRDQIVVSSPDRYHLGRGSRTIRRGRGRGARPRPAGGLRDPPPVGRARPRRDARRRRADARARAVHAPVGRRVDLAVAPRRRVRAVRVRARGRVGAADALAAARSARPRRRGRPAAALARGLRLRAPRGRVRARRRGSPRSAAPWRSR